MMMSLSDGFSIRSSNVCYSQHVLLAYLHYITQCHKDQVFLRESNYLVQNLLPLRPHFRHNSFTLSSPKKTDLLLIITQCRARRVSRQRGKNRKGIDGALLKSAISREENSFLKHPCLIYSALQCDNLDKSVFKIERKLLENHAGVDSRATLPTKNGPSKFSNRQRSR